MKQIVFVLTLISLSVYDSKAASSKDMRLIHFGSARKRDSVFIHQSGNKLQVRINNTQERTFELDGIPTLLTLGSCDCTFVQRNNAYHMHLTIRAHCTNLKLIQDSSCKHHPEITLDRFSEASITRWDEDDGQLKTSVYKRFIPST